MSLTIERSVSELAVASTDGRQGRATPGRFCPLLCQYSDGADSWVDSSLVWDSLGPGPRVWDCPSSVLLPLICWSAALCRRWSTRVLLSVVAVVLECCILPPWSVGVLHFVAADLLECCTLSPLVCWSAALCRRWSAGVLLSAVAVVLECHRCCVDVHALCGRCGRGIQSDKRQRVGRAKRQAARHWRVSCFFSTRQVRVAVINGGLCDTN